MSKTEGNVKFILLMLAFFVLALFQQAQQGRQDTVITRQNILVEKQAASGVGLCENQNRSSTALNALIDDLVVNAESTAALMPKERDARIIRYRQLILPIQDCQLLQGPS